MYDVDTWKQNLQVVPARRKAQQRFSCCFKNPGRPTNSFKPIKQPDFISVHFNFDNFSLELTKHEVVNEKIPLRAAERKNLFSTKWRTFKTKKKKQFLVIKVYTDKHNKKI